MEKYLIVSFYNGKIRSYYHSDKKFYNAYISVKGCNLRTYSNKSTAIAKLNLMRLKGVEMGIIKVLPNQSIENGEIVYKKYYE